MISGYDEFFTVTKNMHNALQGMSLELTPAMRATYLHANVDNAVYFEDEFDFVIVHDPQPAPLRMLRPTDSGLLDLALPHRSDRGQPRVLGISAAVCPDV